MKLTESEILQLFENIIQVPNKWVSDLMGIYEPYFRLFTALNTINHILRTVSAPIQEFKTIQDYSDEIEEDLALLNSIEITSIFTPTIEFIKQNINKLFSDTLWFRRGLDHYRTLLEQQFFILPNSMISVGRYAPDVSALPPRYQEKAKKYPLPKIILTIKKGKEGNIGGYGDTEDKSFGIISLMIWGFEENFPLQGEHKTAGILRYGAHTLDKMRDEYSTVLKHELSHYLQSNVFRGFSDEDRKVFETEIAKAEAIKDKEKAERERFKVYHGYGPEYEAWQISLAEDFIRNNRDIMADMDKVRLAFNAFVNTTPQLKIFKDKGEFFFKRAVRNIWTVVYQQVDLRKTLDKHNSL